MKTFYRILICILIITACDKNDDKLFWVTQYDGKENDFLKALESKRAAEIWPDSLNYYLTKNEIVDSENLTFKSLGKIHNDEKFDIYLLFIGSKDDDDIKKIVIRTFNKNFKMIDSYEFAKWIDNKNLLCFGSIDKNLTVIKNCIEEEKSEMRRISNNGKILSIKFPVNE
jgi:hypothetical protein